jgi:hypothetical protein
MANYDWRDYRDQAWINRFPSGVRGLDAWRTAGLEAAVVRLMEARQAQVSAPSRACVFVSHRQADAAKAERLAYVACKEEFDYWLDIFDPSLVALSGPSGASSVPQQKASAIAAIIEMALLNSTHLLAVITTNTKGSEWVPYEYGRVKDPQPVTLQAACWVDTNAAITLPDYLHLGRINHSESDVRHWLQAERRRLNMYGPPTCSWSRAVPAPI